MSVHIDPSLPAAQPAPSAPSHPATPISATAATAPVPGVPAAAGAAPSDGAGPAPAAPAPAPQKTQVSISPQGRQSLGEATAALQGQATLLDALNPAPAATAPRTAAGVAAGVALLTAANAASSASTAPGTGLLGAAANAALLANATHSAHAASAAQQTLGASSVGAAGALTASASASAASATGGAAPSGAATATTGATATAATGATGATRLALPTGGVSAPMQSLLSALVQQTTAAVQAQRVLAAQPWPAALVAQLAQPAPAGAKAGPGQALSTASLQTWLVNQGVVQTAEGPRGVSVTVRVPGPWLEALGQAQTAATPNRSWQVWLLPTVPHTPAPAAPPLQAAFAGPSQALQSGTYALALESAGAAAGRTSALVTLEFQPLLASSALQSGVYGRDLAHLRQDPWLQMTALQASGQVERDENRARNGSDALCDTVGCPYMGQAACVQPFCAALQVLPQVASLQAPGTGSASRI